MRNERRLKLGIAVTLTLGATALGGTNVLAFPAPVDTTTASDGSILPPPPGTRPWIYPYPAGGTMIIALPGRNVRVPAFASLQASPEPLEPSAVSIGRSPTTGRNVRVPAF